MPSFLHSGNYSFFLNDTYDPVVDLQSKLAYMWDAEYSSTITRDGGGLVSEWRDLVDGTPMVQATAANKPTYSATSFGGGAGVTFDGVNDELTYVFAGGHRFPLAADPVEIWVLVSSAAPDTNTNTLYFFTYGTNTGARSVGRFGSPYPEGQTTGGYHNRSRASMTGTGTTNCNPNADLGLNTRFYFRMTNNGTTTTMQNNGATFGGPVNNSSVPMVPATITGRARMGASSAPTIANWAPCTIACVAVFTTLLTIDECDAMETYLHQRRRLD